MNERSEHHGKDHDHQVIDLMPAHNPKKVDGAYNRAAYMPSRRELATTWAQMLSNGLPEPTVLVDQPLNALGRHFRRRSPPPADAGFRFSRSPRALMVRRSD